MSVETEKVPPVPQHDLPLEGQPHRFANSWMHWFVQVKFKVDVINENLLGISQVSGAGLVIRKPDGTWSQIELEGTTGRITVTNGNGASGNPTINIDPNWVGQTTLTTVGTITVGTWEGNPVAVAFGGTGAATAAAARNNLGAAKALTVTSTSATGGTATALPAQPVGYVEAEVNGVVKKIPYYDP